MTRFCCARVARASAAFLLGCGAGCLIFGPQLAFLFGIFGPFSLMLWMVGGFWIGAFVLLGRAALVQCGPRIALLLLPAIWLACEYFRSELYWLRFSWLIPGYVFAGNGQPLPIRYLGVYGVGYLLALASVTLWQLERKWAIVAGGLMLAALAVAANFVGSNTSPREAKAAVGPVIAGVQLEFPRDDHVVAALDEVVRRYDDVELIVLSEYTFAGGVPDRVRAWCRKNQRYLVAGGKDMTGDGPPEFYNTAFVVDPNGEIVFKQAKSVPIQFFMDGHPAAEQQVWESPWGKIGICICYDMSYSRVTDALVRQGAQALIVPTMDVTSWGERQHRLHGKVAPSRAAEYGIPIVRVCSSGISQIVDRSGYVRASLPFPGQGEMFSERVPLGLPGSVPLDRSLVWPAMIVTAGFIVVAVSRGLMRRVHGIPDERQLPSTKTPPSARP
jgi:apolipoprotein N-acyltransferase